MAVFSIIRKSQLEGAFRLDAEYYQPEYLKLINNLDRLGAIPIRNIVINPKRKFNPVKGGSFQYIEISEVNLSTGEYNKAEIMGENAPDRAQWVVQKDDVIISMVRPIRNAVSLIKENSKNLVCSSGFAVLKPENIEPEYLFAYLKSRPIVELFNRKTTATMYPAITVEDILETKIYLGDLKFREEIKNQVIESQKELEDSKFLYSQAENLLLEELGLKDFKTEDDLFSIVNLSDVKLARRIDAEYFQPKYQQIIEKIEKYAGGWEYLEKITLFINNGNQPPYSENGKIKFFSQKWISDKGIDYSFLTDSEEPKVLESFFEDKRNSPYLIRKNDILYYSVGAHLGYCHNYLENEHIAIGSFINLIRGDETKINPIFLGICLNSIIGRLQAERDKSGMAQPYIYAKDLRKFKVPIVKPDIQQKIADLVQKSHESRKRAKSLLEQAKSKVEELIEDSSK